MKAVAKMLKRTVMLRRSKLIAAICLGIFLLYFCSGHLISFAWQNGGFRFESGEYHSDRIDNMAFAMAAKTLGPTFVDPVNKSDLIFYQHFGYWLLGGASNLVDIEPWTLANIVHVFYPLLLGAAALFTFIQITDRFYISLASVLLLFSFGSLDFVFQEPQWYGVHAILLTLSKQTYGFYMDSYSLAFGIAALGCFVKAHKEEGKGFFLPAGSVFTSLSILTHYLSGLYIFCVLLASCICWSTDWLKFWRVLRSNKSTAFLALSLFISYYIILSVYEWRPPMLIIGGYIAASFVYIARYRTTSRYYLFLGLSAILPIAYAGVNIFSIYSSGADGLNYNTNIRNIDLSIPAWTFIRAYAPVLLGCIAAVALETNKASRGLYIAIIAVSLIFIFNAEMGYNNHPYRFIPYSMPLLVCISVKGFYELARNARSSRVIAKGLLYSLTFGIGICLFTLGVKENLNEHARFAPSQNKLVDKDIDVISDFLNRFPGNHHSVFFVDPRLVSMRGLAPYTSVRLAASSMTNPRQNLDERDYEEGLISLLTLLQKQPTKRLKIDYVLTSQDIGGIASRIKQGPRVKGQNTHVYALR